MSIEIYDENDTLFLYYSPDTPNDLVHMKLNNYGKIVIKKVFEFKEVDLYENDTDDNSSIFKLGVLDNKKKYFIIKGEKLGILYDIYFDRNIKLKKEYFIGERNISIFKNIYKVITGNMIIGIEDDVDININVFEKMIASMPNSYEIERYIQMRIYNIIKDEFDKIKDTAKSYEKYMNKKYSKKEIIIDDIIFKNEKSKYEYLLNKLKNMLSNELLYNEKIWQEQNFDILKIIFPKYIHILKEVPIHDYYNDNKIRRIDFLLVDINGNIDIIEIKRPHDELILTENEYRENFVPKRELAGSVMQIEKYLFFLSKSGKKGEEALNKYFHEKINSEIVIKIINPTGIIIMGRDKGIKEEQINDFEIIKRKYKNIIDIITYDDIIRRLEQLILKYS